MSCRRICKGSYAHRIKIVYKRRSLFISAFFKENRKVIEKESRDKQTRHRVYKITKVNYLELRKEEKKMKNTKKFASVLLALVLVLAMSIPAFAADTWTGNITINSAPNVSVDGKTFNAYKLLDAEAVDATDLSKGVIYSFNAKWQGFFDANFADMSIDDVVAAINAYDAEELNDFAEKAYKYAKDNSIAVDATATGADGKATFSDLAFGYYLIEDAGAATPISALMLKSTSAEVTLKADKPTIVKKIDGDNDADGETAGLVDYNTAKVGDKVPYVLTSKVPATDGYKDYTYVITDTFSEGLTYDGNATVTIGGNTYTDFTASYDEATRTLTIDINGLTTQTEGAEIVVAYTATVNENAEFGVEGNPNKVLLEYSNNPTAEDVTEKTPEDETRTYLVDIVINKTDEKDQPLAGARFAIENANGDVIATGTSDENGLVVFEWTAPKGFRDGETYTIVETDAPAGYNAAKDIEFTVDCTYPTEPDTKCVWAGSNSVTFDANDDRLETTVKNSTGSLLPETGGMGTTLFYMLGGLLVVGAALLLVTKKRMAYEA